MKRPIAIDLFAGCGGMSLGLEAAGFDIAASIEIDPIHSLVHHFNFPYSVTICRDIAQVSSQEILNNIKNKGFSTEIDLIAGGPPCQGFSLIGKREINDPRNSLIFEFLRIIKEINPKYFLFENVPGISNGKSKHILEEFIEKIDDIGYKIITPIQVLDAVNFGAAQKRKRLILMGYRKDLKPPSYPQEKSKFYTVFDAISDLCDHCRATEGDLEEPLRDRNVFIKADAVRSEVALEHSAHQAEDKGINSEELDYSNYRKNFNIIPDGEFIYCHKRSNKNIIWGHLGSKHTPITIERFKITEPGKREQKSRLFKLSSDGQCNTLRAGTSSDKGAHTAPRPIHYLHPRCITIREGARLHSFPDWFQFHRTIWHGFREIGNAVVPFLALSLGQEIIKCLDINVQDLEIYNLPEVNENLLSYNLTQAAKYFINK